MMKFDISRRALLGGSVAAGVGALFLGSEVAANAAEVLPGFPAGISARRDRFRSWDGVITTEPLWTSEPRSQSDVVAIVNWAALSGYKVRARGYMHSWSPLTVERGTLEGERVILVDTTKYLTAMEVPASNRVRVETGARMDTLLDFLHTNGSALASAPAPGDVTVGGVIAVNGHGTAVRAVGEQRVAGQSMGTMSNLVTSLTAVVWDAATAQYAARTFGREHPDVKALLTGIGRTFLLEVTLQTMPDYKLRSQSTTELPASKLFASPESAGSQSLSSLLDKHGRVGLIWYTFTEYPWVQTWTVSPRKPLLSRPTVGPYNYPFADNLPAPATTLLGQLISGQDWVAPAFGAAVLTATSAGLTTTLARDIWGPAKDIIHFVKPTTLRVSAGSHAVVTTRANVQRVVHEFSEWVRGALADFASRHEYPLNSCVEIRVTGVDSPGEVDVPGAQTPALSAARPVDGHPDWDTVVWLDALTLPGTAHEFEFFAQMEAFIRQNYTEWALARPEWAKRWATTEQGSWTDQTVIDTDIPAAFPEWEWVRSTFDSHDPHRLFTNPLLDRLMPPR